MTDRALPAFGVGDGADNLAAHHVRRVEQAHHPSPILGGLAHLAGRVGEIHQPGTSHRDHHLRHREHRSVGRVEPLREGPGELDVLALVVADGHVRGAVEQDVGSHQHRIGVEGSASHRPTAALLLELGHPVQLAHVGGALQQVGELRVRRHPTLLEQRRVRRVEPARQHQGPHLGDESPQGGGVVCGGHRMQVGDPEETGNLAPR